MNKDEKYKIFNNELWTLRPFGDPKDLTWSAVKSVLGTLDEDDNVVTLEYLINKYKKYLNYKSSLLKVFTQENKEILSIKRWIEEKEYLQDYKVNIPINEELDKYLYGE